MANSGKTWNDILEFVNSTTDFVVKSAKEREAVRAVFKNAHKFNFSFHNIKHAKKIFCAGIEISQKLYFDEDKIKFLSDDGSQQYSLSTVTFTVLCPTCEKESKFRCNPSIERKTLMCKSCQKKVLHKCCDVNDNYEYSMQSKYGVKRPIQNKDIRKQICDTMIARYGAPYSMQSPIIVETHKKNMLRKYGKENYFSGINPAIEFFEAYSRIQRNGSKFEREIAEFVNTLDSSAYSCVNRQYYVDCRDACYALDVYSKKANFAIEAHGDYWHANPKLYEKTKLFSGGLTMEEIHRMDETRINRIKEKLNCQFLIVWESEWKQHRSDIETKIRERILECSLSNTILAKSSINQLSVTIPTSAIVMVS